ncbi:hypothetical protein FOL47_001667 [Perkinsus chesapeaki]|uniref:RING-type domain-containing protein n=1 Tax=Perkinsus chesapeaki TaxID=330153 RepID=A0A7J6MJS1_PERCH|nr:hypothetical protein FOL47_001667 [Perkinsus chesapeaki]
MPRKHKSRRAPSTPSSTSSTSTKEGGGVNRSVAEVSKAREEFTASLQPHVAALSKALSIVLTKRWLLLGSNGNMDDATECVFREHQRVVEWLRADMTKRAEQLLVSLRVELEAFQQKHGSNLGRIIRHLDGVATSTVAEPEASTDVINDIITSASHCAAEMLLAVKALLDHLDTVDLNSKQLKDEEAINTWALAITLETPPQLRMRADFDTNRMGQQESRTLPPLPQQRVIRLNPDGTSTEVVLNPSGHTLNADSSAAAQRGSGRSPGGEQLTPVSIEAYVDRSSFRVDDGKLSFTVVASADAMVTVYMNAINKNDQQLARHRHGPLRWPVLSYEHSETQRVACLAPETRTQLTYELEPATVILKAMSQQRWPLVVEVFVAATQSGTMMYLTAADSNATAVRVSEQVHKLPNGTVVATGALYGLSEITKNNNGSANSSGLEQDRCSICLSNPINTALLPCGHTALCADCARLLQDDPANSKCPICRAHVISSSKKAKDQEQEQEPAAAAVAEAASDNNKTKKKARERANDVKLEPDSLEQRRRELQRTIQKTVRKMREEGVDEALIKVEINRIKNREQRTLMHAVKQQQRVEKGSKHEVVVIPIAWKQKAREKAEVDSASIAVKRALLSAGVDAWLDHRREYTPGQKFAYWEHLGVKFRVEIGPNDVAQNQCVVVRADEPGEWLKHQRKRGVRLSCRGIISALIELGYDGGGAAGDIDRLDDGILEGTAGQDEDHDEGGDAHEEVDEDLAGNVALSSDAPKREKRKTPYKSFLMNKKRQRTSELLSSLRREKGSSERARCLIDEAFRTQKIVPDSFTYSQAFLLGAYSCSEIAPIVRAKVSSLNTVAVNSAIASCARMGCEAEARELLRLSESNSLANTRTYNAFLATVTTGSAALTVWRSIPAGLKDGYTLQLVLNRLAQDGHPPKDYHTVLQEVRGIIPTDRHHLATVISGCIRGGYPLDGLEALKAANVKACDDKVLATCVLCAYERLGMWRESIDLVGAIDEPDAVCYTVAMAVCARAGRGKEAVILWGEMRNRGLTPQRQSLSAVVRACEAAGDYDNAIRILSEIGEEAPKVGAVTDPTKRFASSRPERITLAYRDLLCDRLELSLNRGSAVSPLGVADHRQETVRVGVDFGTGPAPHQDALAKLLPSTEERMRALAAVTDLKGLAEKVGLGCIEYGAAAAGLALPHGDVDVTLVPQGFDSSTAWLESLSDADRSAYPPRESAQACLLSLYRMLNDRSPFGVVATGLGGRVPVLTILHKATKTVMDVTYINALGCRKSIWLSEQVAELPQLKDAIRVVKYWMKRHGMTGQSRGWLGGYSLAVAMVGVAKAIDAPNDCETLCRAFVRLLRQMDIERHCISPRLGGVVPKVCGRGQSLSIEDPIEIQWDLGAILGEERTAALLGKIGQVDAWCARNSDSSLTEWLLLAVSD